MIVPSGQRRQMESQSYLWNEHDDQVESIIESMLRKAAALDIDPNAAADTMTTPKPQVQPDSTGAEVPGKANDVADALNQSNGLVPEQPQQTITVVDKNGQPRQDNQGQMVEKILAMLMEGNWASPGAYVVTDFDTSNGIQLNAVLQSPKTGPVVEHK